MNRQEIYAPNTAKKRTKRPRKRWKKGWWKIPLTVLLTLAVFAGAWCLVLGSNGLSLMEGYLLARFAFVEADADLDYATDQALDALVTGLGDRWSYYRDEESYEALRERRANNYVGVGITVTYDREEGLFVQEVTEGGPAQQAGIVPGDVVVAVDGQSIAGEARYAGADLITGESGTQVELTLLGADGSTRTVTCTRAVLRNPSASGKLLEGNVGYVKLSNFYSGAAESFAGVVDGLVAEGAESLIIDLRDDPGGYVTELTDILDYLLPEGPVFRQDHRWWFEVVSKSDEGCVDLPMVTIVNADSYSAAELLAAELREFGGTPVVGVQTSGKGYSQLTFPLLNGGAMGLSTAKYFTGEGVSLIGTGIVPDVVVERTGDTDTQLQAALDLLK